MNEGLNRSVILVEDDPGVWGPTLRELAEAKRAVEDYARRRRAEDSKYSMRNQIKASARAAAAREARKCL